MGFPHVCTGVYILCSHVGLLSLFPSVVALWVHGDHLQLRLFCSFLGLFAAVHEQDAQIRSTAHWVPLTVLSLLELY
jgi:hypothetical protein